MATKTEDANVQVEPEKVLEPVYTFEKLIIIFKNRQDLLRVLLDKSKTYTKKEVEQMITEFDKRGTK